MALDIREKQVNSALENFKNWDERDSSKNLEKAWKKLQLIQKKVSLNTAQEVMESSNGIRENISQEENISEEFKVYILEEEKTELTAEWVVEMNGEEGQNETNVVVNGTVGQNRTQQIETRIDEIDGEISNWVIVNEVKGEEGTGGGLTWEVKTEVAHGDNGLKPEVKTEVANGDNGLKPEIKTSSAGDGTLKNDTLPEPDLNQVNPDLYDPNARAPGDTVDDTYDDASINNGNCGDGVVCEN
jgi:hypothetical protein